MSASATLLDDGLLLRLVGGDLPATIASTPLCSTTGYWFRLARATASDAGGGLFSQALARCSDRDAALLRRQVEHVDELVRIADVRRLVALMARLAVTHGLNLLAAEVLAAALVFDARIAVVHGNVGPRLTSAAAAVGVEVAEVAT